MMEKCHGVMGWLFGHSYMPVVTMGEPPSCFGGMEGRSRALIKVINSTRPEVFHGIYCKRCGSEVKR